VIVHSRKKVSIRNSFTFHNSARNLPSLLPMDEDVYIEVREDRELCIFVKLVSQVDGHVVLCNARF
jgi:hypothetical protein